MQEAEEGAVVMAERQQPRTSFRAMRSAASSVSERPTFSTPCRTLSRRAAASAAAAARAASAAAAAAGAPADAPAAAAAADAAASHCSAAR